MDVAVLFDLVTRDGRTAVEVRQAQALGTGFFASAKGTIYSCAYDDDLGRSVALTRARQLCDTNKHTIVHYASADKARRAAWQ
jgi:hypothetical protein